MKLAVQAHLLGQQDTLEAFGDGEVVPACLRAIRLVLLYDDGAQAALHVHPYSHVLGALRHRPTH